MASALRFLSEHLIPPAHSQGSSFHPVVASVMGIGTMSGDPVEVGMLTGALSQCLRGWQAAADERRWARQLRHGRPLVAAAVLLLVALAGGSCTNVGPPLKLARIAYIYRFDGGAARANDFSAFLLRERGAVVRMVAVEEVTSTDFSRYDAIVIGAETGASLVTGREWGADTTGNSARYVAAFGVPVLGLGRGGALFFELARYDTRAGRTAGGWVAAPNVEVVDGAQEVWSWPNDLGVETGDAVTVYPGTMFEEALYSEDLVNVWLVGKSPWEPDPGDVNAYYSLTSEDGNWWWGWDGGPSTMTDQGRRLFINVLAQMTPPKELFVNHVPGVAKSSGDEPTPLVLQGSVVWNSIPFELEGRHTFSFWLGRKLVLCGSTNVDNEGLLGVTIAALCEGRPMYAYLDDVLVGLRLAEEKGDFLYVTPGSTVVVEADIPPGPRITPPLGSIVKNGDTVSVQVHYRSRVAGTSLRVCAFAYGFGPDRKGCKTQAVNRTGEFGDLYTTIDVPIDKYDNEVASGELSLITVEAYQGWFGRIGKARTFDLGLLGTDLAACQGNHSYYGECETPPLER